MDKAYADEQLELAFSKYSNSIERYCFIRLGEANELAGDCVQDTYCLYYRKLLDGERFDNPRAFLYKTANNMVLKAKEKYFLNAKRNKSLDDAENIAVYVDEKIDIKMDEMLDIEKAKSVIMSQLNDLEIELYQLKYVENKSLNDISIILGISPTAVAKRTSRLRQKIKSLVSPTLDDFRKGEN